MQSSKKAIIFLKQLQLLAVATLISIHTLECSQLTTSNKKNISSVLPRAAVQISYYCYDQHQTNQIYKETIATCDQLGVQYTNEVIIEDNSILNLTKQYSDHVKDLIAQKNELTVNAGLYTADQLTKIQKDFLNSHNNGLRKDIKIKKINDVKGYGAFATKNIPQGCSIGTYTGIVRHSTEIADTSYAFSSLHVCMRPGCPNPLIGGMQVDGLKSGNITRFINAPSPGSESNCDALDIIDKDNMPQILFVTNKAIKAGEELTLDYGSKYPWSNERV